MKETLPNSLAAQGLKLPPIRGGETTAVNVRPISRNQVRTYAAAKTDRLTLDWTPSGTSANAEIQASARPVRNRSRQQERDNPYISKAVGMYENNVIGSEGIKLQMKVNDIGRDGTETADKRANSLIEDAWRQAGSLDNCSVTRDLSRDELYWMIVGAIVRDGGILIREYVGFDNEFGYALQPLEVDHLDFDFNRSASTGQNAVRMGIEIDRFGAPVAYHLLTVHPGDVFGSAPRNFRERVLASEIYAIWDIRSRPEQLTGMPRFASSLTRLNMLDKYEEAEQVASRISACKGGFFENTTPPEEYPGPRDDQGNPTTEMQPGMIEDLPFGKTFKPLDPTHPTDAYPHFMKTGLRGVSSGVRLNYNSLANDGEGINYSTIRAFMLEDREEYKKLQKLIIVRFLDRMFPRWLSAAMLKGKIALPFAKFEKFNAATFQGRRWPWVDPEKDVKADVLAIAARLKSRKSVIAEDGGDIEDVDSDFNSDDALKDLDVNAAYNPNGAAAIASAEAQTEKPPVED